MLLRRTPASSASPDDSRSAAQTSRRHELSNSAHTLATRLHELISAAFTAIWCQTAEPHEAARANPDLCRVENWRLGIWNCDSGIQFPIE